MVKLGEVALGLIAHLLLLNYGMEWVAKILYFYLVIMFSCYHVIWNSIFFRKEAQDLGLGLSLSLSTSSTGIFSIILYLISYPSHNLWSRILITFQPWYILIVKSSKPNQTRFGDFLHPSALLHTFIGDLWQSPTIPFCEWNIIPNYFLFRLSYHLIALELNYTRRCYSTQ